MTGTCGYNVSLIKFIELLEEEREKEKEEEEEEQEEEEE